MEIVLRFSLGLLHIIVAGKCIETAITSPPLLDTGVPVTRSGISYSKPLFNSNFTTPRGFSSASSSAAKEGWFLGLGGNNKVILPDIVKAGDPVLHEPAGEVLPDEIKADSIQKIIHDMIKVMRKAPGVGLAAPQIEIPLRIISFGRYKGIY